MIPEGSTVRCLPALSTPLPTLSTLSTYPLYLPSLPTKRNLQNVPEGSTRRLNPKAQPEGSTRRLIYDTRRLNCSVSTCPLYPSTYPLYPLYLPSRCLPTLIREHATPATTTMPRVTSSDRLRSYCPCMMRFGGGFCKSQVTLKFWLGID